ncbi:MAG: SsrA RNA (tmRNA)-binding protein [uncultured bacterium]|nr:MAG: SsrA RNA (tmRNA)-binding protein [uncultured bacterium]
MSTLAINKRAKFDYEFLETFEGGLVLTGAEVKSAKQGHVQLKGAFVTIKNQELWLRSAHITAYKPAGAKIDYDPTRERKILVRRREAVRLIGKAKERGLTLIPIRLYTKGNLVKIEFALARGKRQYEKREAIKKREIDKKIREFRF